MELQRRNKARASTVYTKVLVNGQVRGAYVVALVFLLMKYMLKDFSNTVAH